MTPTNITPTSVSLVVPTAVTLIPFAQMQQKQAADIAIGDSNKMVLDKKAKDEFKGMMPEWMLEMGNAYETQEKFNSSNGDMGKFLADMTKISVLKESFSKLVSTLGSFGALKAFLNADKAQAQNGESAGWTSMKNDVGTMANEIMNEANAWTPNGDQTSIQNQNNSEFNILSQRAQSLGTQADGQGSVVKTMQSAGNTLNSDEGSVSDFLAQMSQALGAASAA